MHDTPLISLIAIGLVLALVGRLIAVRVGLSPIADYLVAGIAVGPFMPGLVGDATLAPQLAEIGVILLLMLAGALLAIVFNPFVFNLSAGKRKPLPATAL